MEDQQDRDTIADEAVGQRHGTPPDFVKEREAISPEEAIRRNATPPGPLASMSEKTAAALGERVGDAYANTGHTQLKRQEGSNRSVATKSRPQNGVIDHGPSAGQALAQGLSNQVSGQPLASLVAAFGLGFIVATVVRARR
jgi:hypothetical protein